MLHFNTISFFVGFFFIVQAKYTWLRHTAAQDLWGRKWGWQGGGKSGCPCFLAKQVGLGWVIHSLPCQAARHDGDGDGAPGGCLSGPMLASLFLVQQLAYSPVPCD